MACVMRQVAGMAWVCETHDCPMHGTMYHPPVLCLVAEKPTSRKAREKLAKEHRLLLYRRLIGTLTPENRFRMADLETLLK